MAYTIAFFAQSLMTSPLSMTKTKSLDLNTLLQRAPDKKRT